MLFLKDQFLENFCVGDKKLFGRKNLGEVQLIQRREDPKSSHLLPEIDIQDNFLPFK